MEDVFLSLSQSMGIEWHGAQRNGRREVEFTLNYSKETLARRRDPLHLEIPKHQKAPK